MKLTTKFREGDRVVYSGPVINEAWPITREGMVTGVRTVELINIQWDEAGLNIDQPASDFSHVPEGAGFRTRGRIMSENIYQPGTRGNAEREAAATLVTERDPIDPTIVRLIGEAHGGDIQKAVEDFYVELDRIASSDVDASLPGVIEGREWLAAIEYAIGDPIEGYRDWMQESWEPLDELKGEPHMSEEADRG